MHYGFLSLGRGSVSKTALFMMFFGSNALILMVYDQKGVPGIGEVPVLAISSINIVRILDEI